jgi:tRNA:m(5)U-54 methyltransferase
VPALPDGPTIVATGPLTSPALAEVIAGLSGRDYLYFYDAVSPIVQAETVDMTIAFRQSRYDREGSASLQARGEQVEGDYINCPMTRDEYEAFVDALLSAETIVLKQFEREDPHFFEGCMPVEALARRGREALAFGPMRPVGLIDPRNGQRPYAVVQLRQDNLIGTLYNLVGFQTNLKWPDQKRVLRLIPGLAQAEFVRYGMMHRNTYVNAPALLQPTLQYRNRADLFFAGQIVGVEGYVGNAGTGLLAGVNAARLLTGGHPLILPPATMLGALCHLRHPRRGQGVPADEGQLRHSAAATVATGQARQRPPLRRARPDRPASLCAGARAAVRSSLGRPDRSDRYRMSYPQIGEKSLTQRSLRAQSTLRVLLCALRVLGDLCVRSFPVRESWKYQSKPPLPPSSSIPTGRG